MGSIFLILISIISVIVSGILCLSGLEVSLEKIHLFDRQKSKKLVLFGNIDDFISF